MPSSFNKRHRRNQPPEQPRDAGSADSTSSREPTRTVGRASERVPSAPRAAGAGINTTSDVLQASRTASAWTVAIALILLAAFGLRALNLGAQPLQPAEAAVALQAWSVDRGDAAGLISDPGLLSGVWLVFALFGASDTAARLFPLLLGMTIVALPLLARLQLGSGATLLSMLFLATSPTLVYYSRHAQAAILVSAAGLATVLIGYRCWESGGRRHLAATGVAVGTLLLAGPNAYYTVAALALYAAIAWIATSSRRYRGLAPLFPAPSSASSDGLVSGAGPLPARGRVALVAGGVTALLGSTAWLTNPAGLQGLLDSFGLWLTGLFAPGPSSPAIYLVGLIGYEPLLVLLTIQGGVIATRRQDPLGSAMVWWTLIALGLAMLGGERPVEVQAQLVVPMALLGGAAVARALRSVQWQSESKALAYFAVGALVLLSNVMIATDHVSTPDPVVPTELALVSWALLFVGVALSVGTLGRIAAIRYANIVLVGALWIFSVHTATTVSQGPVADTAVQMTGLATSPAARDVAKDVADIVDNLALDRKPFDVTLDSSLGAVPRWYMRVDAIDGPPPTDPTRPSIQVSAANAKAPRGAYSTQRYVIAETRAAGPTTWKSLWRWLVFKEGAGQPVPVEAVVYVRTAAQRP